MDLSIDDKYNLITRNLQEIVGSEDAIKTIIEKRPLKIYWGTAPTGRIHIGYFIPLLKIADYLKAGCQVKILIADLHAYLDSMKSNLEQLEYRSQYYQIMITEILKSLNVDVSQLEFVKGRNYQLTPEYTMDVYRLMSIFNLKEARHAGAEVVKQSQNPLMTSLMYPGLQALDEEYLKVDVQTGGVDQRKIFMAARKFLPKLGYKKRMHFMTPMVGGIRFTKTEPIAVGSVKEKICSTCGQELSQIYDLSNKMSASNPDSKIDILDDTKTIKRKLNKAYCLSGNADDNSLLEILKMVVFPILSHKDELFVIDRPEKYGGIMKYDSFEQVYQDFKSEKLHPVDLKLGLSLTLDRILNPIRSSFSSPPMTELINLAY